VWRTLAYLYFVMGPLGTISALVASIVLVRTYGRSSQRQ
jgi:hypothetical protein